MADFAPAQRQRAVRALTLMYRISISPAGARRSVVGRCLFTAGWRAAAAAAATAIATAVAGCVRMSDAALQNHGTL